RDFHVTGVQTCALPIFLSSTAETVRNYSYFPVLVTEEYPLSRDELYEKLKQNNVFSRRYFYPLISHFPMYSGLTSANAKNLSVRSEERRVGKESRSRWW